MQEHHMRDKQRILTKCREGRNEGGGQSGTHSEEAVEDLKIQSRCWEIP